MKQRTHTWLAIRAIGLLEDAGVAIGLVKILKPNITSTAIGAWIPDLQDSKLGSGDIDNHVLKMKPYKGYQKKRFTLKKADLFKKLGKHRKMRDFIDDWDSVLGSSWWNDPYKADPTPGEHIPGRAMALTTTLIDQLILGDPDIASKVPGSVSFAHQVNSNARSRSEQVATYFFMLSHFVADACQPCHCDARRLSGYSNGVHKELEAHWNKIVGTYFEKSKLTANTDTPYKVLKAARAVDSKFDITFDSSVPDLVSGDTWLEMMFVCRAAFAMASIIANPTDFPYSSTKLTKFKDVFDPAVVPELLDDLDKAVMHDAVLNIAIIWKEVWSTFK